MYIMYKQRKGIFWQTVTVTVLQIKPKCTSVQFVYKHATGKVGGKKRDVKLPKWQTMPEGKRVY